MGKYQVILADPPWQYRNAGGNGAAENHYPTMSIADLCALPIGELAQKDAVLLLWATWPQLPEAIQLISAWGFSYKSGFPWIKIQGEPQRTLWGKLKMKLRMGTGHWVRGCSEMILIAKRGTLSPPVPGRRFCGLISEQFAHSRKPENIYHYAEGSFDGPYLELFCRRPRPGWDVWGNEVESTIELFDGSVYTATQ